MYLTPCRFEGCERIDCVRSGKNRGYCKGHWQQLARGKGLTPLRGTRSKGACLERDDLGRKHCIACDEWLRESEFALSAASLDGLSSRCASCALLGRYGITKADYDRMLASQKGLCAICGLISTDLVVDHDHACCDRTGSCGKCVRGILCRACNMVIGLARDSAATLRSAAEYIERTAL